MSAAAGVAIAVIAFLYIEIAIGTGYYMFLITGGEKEAQDEEQKQIKKYSILAGVFFPITFTLLIAGHAAEKRNK